MSTAEISLTDITSELLRCRHSNPQCTPISGIPIANHL